MPKVDNCRHGKFQKPNLWLDHHAELLFIKPMYFAIALSSLAVVLSAISAKAQAICPARSVYNPISNPVNSSARAGRVSPAAVGTETMFGSYRDEYEVNAPLLSDIQASIANNCNIFIEISPNSNIFISGTAEASYDINTAVIHERPATRYSRGFSRQVSRSVHTAGSYIPGAALPSQPEIHLQSPRLLRALLQRVQLGDKIAIESDASATATVPINTIGDSQSQVTWFGANSRLIIYKP